ncbi:MAG TPA: rRNA adenine N-6-methyltransferase family protein [Planctomycetota bacterium]|nr:rRNA adenine N-6-methyltransferase family protein [Planctomycetota bacterium]
MPGELQQHDLKPAVARAIVAAAGLQAGDVAVEVGPGKGELTAAALATGATVLAVETNPALVAALRGRFVTENAAGRLGLTTGDIRTVPLAPPTPWRVLANPPFHLTSWLFHHWLLDELPSGPPSRIDLVLQLEAGQKFCGRPAAETRTSILARLFGRPKVTLRLNRDDVTPSSRVDLCLWSIERDPDAPSPAVLARIDRLLERAFAGPHTMREALQGVATGEQIRRQAKERGWNPDDHPRILTPGAWWSLADILAKTGKLR